jgi:hypothetical protein
MSHTLTKTKTLMLFRWLSKSMPIALASVIGFSALPGQSAYARSAPTGILQAIASDRYSPDPSSCQCEVDQLSVACTADDLDSLPSRFRLIRSITYGPQAIGIPTAMGQILFYPAQPNYKNQYTMNLSQVMAQITSDKGPIANPIFRTVEQRRTFNQTRAINSYREQYKKNGSILAVEKHSWEFTTKGPREFEFRNYNQTEEYVDLNTDQPLRIPVVRTRSIKCLARR